jgi:hypothetical protein
MGFAGTGGTSDDQQSVICTLGGANQLKQLVRGNRSHAPPRIRAPELWIAFPHLAMGGVMNLVVVSIDIRGADTFYTSRVSMRRKKWKRLELAKSGPIASRCVVGSGFRRLIGGRGIAGASICRVN